MKLYRLTIQPQGGLGTPLKGDTLFGHFCWQAAHDPGLLQGGLDEQVERYKEHPWVIFSSAFPQLEHQGQIQYAFKRPDLPLALLFPSGGRSRAQQLLDRKTEQQRRWMLVPADLRLDLQQMKYLNDRELADMLHSKAEPDIQRLMSKQARRLVIIPGGQHHNTINRRTGTTGLAPFAPYTQNILYYYPGIKLAIFILVDEGVTNIDKVFKALTKIGQWGYGKDASIGKGRFQVLEEHEELLLPAADDDANAAYTMAPVVPAPQSYAKAYFTPFIRFGRHGGEYARSKNPFKTPVIMADEGAVFVSQDRRFMARSYLGTGIKGISLSLSKTIMQGYSVYLPFRLELNHEGNY